MYRQSAMVGTLSTLMSDRAAVVRSPVGDFRRRLLPVTAIARSWCPAVPGPVLLVGLTVQKQVAAQKATGPDGGQATYDTDQQIHGTVQQLTVTKKFQRFIAKSRDSRECSQKSDSQQQTGLRRNQVTVFRTHHQYTDQRATHQVYDKRSPRECTAGQAMDKPRQ